MFKSKELDINVELDSEYAPAGGIVRGRLNINANKIVVFDRIIVVVRALESSFAGSEGDVPLFEEEMFYKEDAIVYAPKDSTDNLLAPGKPAVYPFAVELNGGVPPSVAYEEALATICYEVIGLVVPVVAKGKKPHVIASEPRDLFVWGTTRMRWNRHFALKDVPKHPLPEPQRVSKGKLDVTAALEERMCWQMGEQLLIHLDIKNRSKSSVQVINVSIQQRAIALMRKFKNRELAVHYPVKAQFQVDVPPGGAFSETIGVPVPSWKECNRIWPTVRGNKFACAHVVTVQIKDAVVTFPLMIFDTLVDKQLNSGSGTLAAVTSADRFRDPTVQVLTRSVSRLKLGTDRANQRLKEEKEGKQTWREAEPAVL